MTHSTHLTTVQSTSVVYLRKKEAKQSSDEERSPIQEMLYITMHSTHFISNMWRRSYGIEPLR